MKQTVLLAYGEKEFTKRIKSVLEKKNYTTAVLREGLPPHAQYNTIIQLAHDPTDITEGTRLLLGKAKKDRSRLIFVNYRLDEKVQEDASRFAQTLIEEAHRKNEAETVILNLGRLYGPGIAIKDSGALGHLITEFSDGNVLTLYGEGRDSDYYLFIDDAVEGVALAVGQAEPGGIYALSPSIATTSEAAAKLLYELGGGRHEISLHRGISALVQKGEVPGKPLPEFKIKTPFHDGILSILRNASPRTSPSVHLPFPRVHLPELHIKLPHPSSRALKIAGIILLLLSPFIYLGGELGLSAYQLNRTKEALGALDFPTAQAASSSAAASLARLGKIFPTVQAFEETALAASDLSSQGSVITTALENLAKSHRGEGTTSQTPEEFHSLSAALSSAEQHLSLAWLEAKQVTSGPLAGIFEKLQGYLEEGIKVTQLGSAFAGDAEDLLGYRGGRSYLILFQNSTEIRSGGGFLGSLAQLTLENGGIKNLAFFDSYQFDNATKAPTETAAKALRGNATSLLREANINASFPVSADEIAGIFEKAQTTQIQGVAGTTLVFAQDLLRATGSITLPSFGGEVVTADNLFEVTTAEVEKNFFPGSTKKERFMQALGEALLGRLFSLPSSQYSQLAKAAWSALEQKNILLYFKDVQLSQALGQANFDGAIQKTDGDFLGVFDNAAGGKVNGIWVERKIAYRVFSPSRTGAAQAELTVTWNHTGTNAWPAKSYSNLLLALAPSGSKLLGAKLNGKTYNKAVTFSESGKTGFAVYITIPYQTETTLVFTYKLPEKFNLDQLSSYHLLIQKQPGTLADPFTFTFEPTIGKTATGDNLQNKNGGLIFEGNLEKDLSFTINLK